MDLILGLPHDLLSPLWMGFGDVSNLVVICNIWRCLLYIFTLDFQLLGCLLRNGIVYSNDIKRHLNYKNNTLTIIDVEKKE